MATRNAARKLNQPGEITECMNDCMNDCMNGSRAAMNGTSLAIQRFMNGSCCSRHRGVVLASRAMRRLPTGHLRSVVMQGFRSQHVVRLIAAAYGALPLCTWKYCHPTHLGVHRTIHGAVSSSHLGQRRGYGAARDGERFRGQDRRGRRASSKTYDDQPRDNHRQRAVISRASAVEPASEVDTGTTTVSMPSFKMCAFNARRMRS